MVDREKSAKMKRQLVVVLAAGLFAGCGEKKLDVVAAASPAAPSDSPAPAAVPLTAADSLSVTGPLIVEHQVEVAAQRDGVVSELRRDAGAHVSTGAILAQLDDRQLTANLEAARAKTRSVAADLKNWQAETEVLQADYARAQRLWNEKLIAEEQLQHAKFKAESDQWDVERVRELLNTSKAEERSLELELEKTRIVAPFDGVVARRYVRSGQAVTKGERLYWVTAEAPLLIRFTLPERFVGRMKTGQVLPLISADVPQEKHTVKIKSVSPVVDPASGTIEVLAELAGSRGGLRPGMTATITIDTLQ
jgi:membrane fusion protein, multidrug efflux system